MLEYTGFKFVFTNVFSYKFTIICPTLVACPWQAVEIWAFVIGLCQISSHFSPMPQFAKDDHRIFINQNVCTILHVFYLIRFQILMVFQS